MTADDRNVALLVSYDGSAHHGWQRHDGRPTVQGTIESSQVRATIRYAVAAGRITSKAKRAMTELMVVVAPV